MDFKTTPFPHQLMAFERFKDHTYFALLADMGTGKTKIAIDICAYKFLEQKTDRVLIIAPNSVHPQWVDEQFPTHCPVAYEGFSYSSSKTLTFLRKMDAFLLRAATSKKLFVLTMNYEAFVRPSGLDLVKRFFSPSSKPPTIIVDEASRIKNPSAKTVKNIKKLRDWYDPSFRIVITGTPAAKSPVDMWSIYDFLSQGYMGCSYIAFQHEYALIVKQQLTVRGRKISVDKYLDPETYKKIHEIIKNNDFGNGINPAVVDAIRKRFGLSEGDFWFIAKSKEFVRFKDVKKLQEKIAPVTFSVSKKDCTQLPEKIYQRVPLTINTEQKRLITDLAKYACATYQEQELTIEVKALLGMRVLQICGGFFSHQTDKEGVFKAEEIKGTNAKLEFIKEDLQEIGTQQFMVWAVFSPEIKLLYSELSKTHAIGVLDGSIDKIARQETVQAFKAGLLQGLISHPEVGGYGLNLQGAGVQYWYSRNYRTEARLQAEDRSHRIGTTISPIYKDLVYNVAFEDRVLQSLKEGLDLNAQFMSTDINELFTITK